jgi:ATP-dependent DNA helicase RecG
MKKAGLKKPLFEFGTFFTIILLRPSEHLAETKSKGVEKGVEKLSEKQKIILSLIKENPSISKEEIQSNGNLSKKSVEYNIELLKRQNILKRVGPDKGGYWEVQK